MLAITIPVMKVLSLNFLTCAVKACKSSSDSYPLHPKDAELVQDEIELNPEMLLNLLPRLDWAALRITCSEVSLKPARNKATLDRNANRVVNATVLLRWLP